MGTRSTIKVFDDNQQLINIYQQFDGYPEGVGSQLADFLKDVKIVNGYISDTPENSYNGAGCLAAAIVKYFKDGIGGCYIVAPNDTEEYNYGIYVDSNTRNIIIKVDNDCANIFSGTVEQFVAFCYNENV